MKFLFILFVVMGTVFGAYFTAQSKLTVKTDFSALKIGQTMEEVQEIFGVPSSQSRNILTYIMPNSSVLTITLRDDVVSSAKVKFIQPVKVTDPELRKLTLVQMDPAVSDDKPSWFFAGSPGEGLIYKITAGGVIESMTWVEPFTFHSQQAKNVQALLRDFNERQTSNM